MPQVQLPIGRTKLPWLAGLAAFLAVAFTIGDPGITVDEPLDVRPGRNYLTLWKTFGWQFWSRPDVIRRTYLDNKEHPPLGRWLLGLASTLGEPMETLGRGPDPVGVYVRSGRLAVALIFGCLVGLIARIVQNLTQNPIAGLASGFALAAMPRLWSHAHLGALDMLVTFFWIWAFWSMLDIVNSWSIQKSNLRKWLNVALAGSVWGLALLVKIHAWLLWPIAFLWMFIKLPIKQAVLAITLWTSLGLFILYLGWPWLWLAPWQHLSEYLATGSDRISIRTQYFGQIYLDKEVPWHYPWIYFLTTVPVGLLAIGAVGLQQTLKQRQTQPALIAVALTIVYWLSLFSTKIAVYDGERLYLIAFGLWAILVGIGFAWLWSLAIASQHAKWLKPLLVIILIAQGWGTVATHPIGLSYHNLLVGGPQGANRLGMETTYWTDGVDSTTLDWLAQNVKPGQTLALTPTLAPDQGKVLTTRQLLTKDVIIQDDQSATTADWIIVHRREAYWNEFTKQLVANHPPEWTRSVQGVWVVGVWKNPRLK